MILLLSRTFLKVTICSDHYEGPSGAVMRAYDSNISNNRYIIISKI